ncbi:alkaline phosphatase D family protein [Flavivirga rizhaonensis]|uniref:Twin-arginine translocation pathway signal n=1 Tax=Flavivirga rizhaonensis TaxID=2559571 RepID=A0A4S1E1I5_9FLAO|nr:alkaline phosphatase D family protein [Flavivirga rizhaonensis]TGV04205.1 twin-arginine translocation pathway signal [Flavivirga rizhaonensis]
MNLFKNKWLLVVFVLFFYSCNNKGFKVDYNFNKINNRVWVGEDFWSVPLEDWRVNNGRVECLSDVKQATLTVLSYSLNQNKSSFKISVKMGLLQKGKQPGSAGIVMGSKDDTDSDFRAAIYFGKGINIGVNTKGYAFINESTTDLKEAFDYSNFKLQIIGSPAEKGYTVTLKVLDYENTIQAELQSHINGDISGIIQLVNNFETEKSKGKGSKFWFDDLELIGEKINHTADNKFGPILWAMHTLSDKTLKLTAQFPPISKKDNQIAELHIQKQGSDWEKITTERIDTSARCASFKVKNWDDTANCNYKIVYPYYDVHGNPKVEEYQGVIKKDPVDKPLAMGALTCQFYTGFPYTPIRKKLELKKPDILYFSGDQIYEVNGGYNIKRHPEGKANNSYLGKWYMFGWVFRDLMRNTPTICTPDDHDIFQGNLWGGGGKLKNDNTRGTHDHVGFDQSIRTINMVNRTQCSHLPDPYDATPIANGMSVWYTQLKYGRVSFAITTDRVFKSGPDEVANWDGRLEQIKDPKITPSDLDKPGLQLMGERQELFLKNWVKDWNGIDMKVLLSQTVLANATTHYGKFNKTLYGDMDSGGWPKKARDETIKIVRKGFAFHIAGDQHLPSLLQYGIDDYGDSGWGFCTPAISICYSRWFRPDDLGVKPKNRPKHGLPNTGDYTDFFGNYNRVYAVGYPGNYVKDSNRYKFENNKTSGFGFLNFNQKTRDITIESWKMLGNDNPEDMDQHYGWPRTINQLDNYGRKSVAWLPTIVVNGKPNPVLQIINQDNNELEYILRINGNKFDSKVFSKSLYTIKIGYPEMDFWKEIKDIKPITEKGHSWLRLDL